MEQLKHERLLELYVRFLEKEKISKEDEMKKYNISSKTFERDIVDLNNFIGKKHDKIIKYDKTTKKYILVGTNPYGLTNSEALIVCKILLESRAFEKSELHKILNKILLLCVPHDQYKEVEALIKNEKEHYIEPQHKTKFIEKAWDLGQAIKNQNYIEIKYKRSDGKIVERKIKPVGIMFSEFYFYLTAFHSETKNLNIKDKNDLNPTIFRIDRIKSYNVLTKEKFEIPYNERFQEGEFRKRIQFMTNGPLKKVKFKYKNTNPEAMLDRLPTAKILKTIKVSETEKHYIVSAEVFGNGIDKWILSNGDTVEIIND